MNDKIKTCVICGKPLKIDKNRIFHEEIDTSHLPAIEEIPPFVEVSYKAGDRDYIDRYPIDTDQIEKSYLWPWPEPLDLDSRSRKQGGFAFGVILALAWKLAESLALMILGILLLLRFWEFIRSRSR